jgi:integrase
MQRRVTQEAQMTIDDDNKVIAELRAELAQLRDMVSSRRRTAVLPGKLNATKIANALKAGKARTIGDGGNLWLQITANGTASWLFRWTERGTGRERVMGVGPLHSIDLNTARQLALNNRKLLLARKDPKKERDSLILDEQIARGLAKTVRQVNEEFYELRYARAPLHTQRGARRNRSMMNSAIGDMPIEKVNRKIFSEKTEFNKLWIEKQPTAKSLQVYGDLLFRFAIEGGYYTSNNPLNWERFKSTLPKKEHIVEHHVPVPYKEMPEFMKKLLAYRWRGRLQYFEGSPPIALCLALVAFSGVRPGEARQAQWKEFDFERMVWKVPWQHLKMGRFHKEDREVPITKPMLAVLNQAKQIAYPKHASKIGDHHKNRGPIYRHARHTPDVSPDAVVFPDAKNQPYDNSGVARFMREHIGWKNKDKYCTPHGFRSTLRDWMRAKTNFRDELWQIQADHAVGKNKSDRSYGPDKLLEQRRVMMEEYGEFCSKPASEPKGRVVKLSEKRRQA